MLVHFVVTAGGREWLCGGEKEKDAGVEAGAKGEREKSCEEPCTRMHMTK